MSAKNPSERFDCLEFKDKVQSDIYERTKGMTRARLSRYFEKRAESGPYAKLWNQISVRSSRSKVSASRRAS